MTHILGLGGPYYHDSSACLAKDGEIVAFVEEERFTRRKQNLHSRSCALSTAYCLSAGRIKANELTEIAYGRNLSWPEPKETIEDEKIIQELLGETAFIGPMPKRVRVVRHHLAHAASTFYPSGFADAAVLVVDGAGDGVSTSIFRGSADGLQLIKEFKLTQSLGWFYETAAEHIGLGRFSGSGKLMGLAAYGLPRFDLGFIEEKVDGYRINLEKFGLSPDESMQGDNADLSYYGRMKEAYRLAFESIGVPYQQGIRQYDPHSGRWENQNEYGGIVRDFAASVQKKLERCLVQLAQFAMRAVGSQNLCIAGGVGLNCTANGVLQRESGATQFFVQPVSNDAGIAIGAALEISRQLCILPQQRLPMRNAALGPCFSNDSVGKLLSDIGLSYEYLGEGLPSRVAESIVRGAVVGWFDGSCEAGPRALGQRSILADPRSTAVRDRINRDIKRREMWRPLAPSMLRSASDFLVKEARTADFMIIAYAASEMAHKAIPGVIHVDGSLRPQIIEDDSSTPYAQLLREFAKITGIGALLNTSFNHEAEPIVCSPMDALRTFFSTPIDELAIQGHLVRKDRQRK